MWLPPLVDAATAYPYMAYAPTRLITSNCGRTCREPFAIRLRHQITIVLLGAVLRLCILRELSFCPKGRPL
jgi:hypothetical protein